METNFNFETDYILENEFVLLKPLKNSDLNHLLHFSLNEPEIWKYSLVPANSEMALKSYIQSAVEAREKLKEYPFVIIDKISGEYAGSSRFYDMQFSNKTLQLGFTWYGKKFQGTGLNKQCKFLLLQFAFETLKMERVEFRADNNNERSIAAMKSIGCVVEGILRNNCPTIDGNRRDSIVLSILKGEWESKVKKNLQEKMINLNSK